MRVTLEGQEFELVEIEYDKLATSDPHNRNEIWNDNKILRFSNGSL